MTQDLPLVSIVMPAYNRARTIERAINSVLNQTYRNVELIIIDDGSTDNTTEVLKRYNGSIIRFYKHEINKGVTAAKNSGLDQIKGEWFTILDSDDEIVPEAIETMMKIPLFYDESITAITCNCWDTSKERFSGGGLTENRYLDINTMMDNCKGEFWGLTKTSLLEGDRFNEKLPGFEDALWYKINDRAKRYYCHSALRIYHTEGADRITKSGYNFKREVNLYENLIKDELFLNKIKRYNLGDFSYLCKTGVMVMRITDRKDLALRYYELIRPINKSLFLKLIYQYKAVALFAIFFKRLKANLKPYLLRLTNEK